jgi:undecaprenyl diphosphate synthase
MVNQDWKERLEVMLSQFNDDGSGENEGAAVSNDNYNFYTPENYSASSNKYDYDFLYGCGGAPITCQSGSSNGQCVSLVLQWMRFVIGGIIKAYISSPLCLALLPLLVGAGIGFLIGWRVPRVQPSAAERKYSDKLTGNDAATSTIILARIYRLYHWLTLHLMLMVISLSNFVRGTNSTNNDLPLLFDDKRDEQTRTDLKAMQSHRESGLDTQYLPRHIAVIMDGNRRHGKNKYNNATRGHWDGCETLVEFTKWCIDEGIQILTVYAFSTENWARNQTEVSALMAIFCKYIDEIRIEALKLGIRVCVLSTEDEKIPENVRIGIDRVVSETRQNDKFTMNICLSYGARGEITNACKSIAQDVQSGMIKVNEVDENEVQKRMLTGHCCCDPDIIIRTSGEERLSNFLLWQAAYSEFFFLKKLWPELQKDDLLEVIRTFANGRQRRYGK